MADVNVKRVGRGIPERRRLYGKRRLPVGLSLAGLRPLVLIGGILPPGGSGVGRRGAPSNVLRVRSLPLPASTAIS